MADSATAAIDAGRRERLQALGLEVLVLREAVALPVRVAAGVEDRTTMDIASARLIVRHAGGDAPDAAHAALLRAILAALGLRDTDTTPHAVNGLPILTFGDEGIAGHVVAPVLEKLRDARAKRALWPLLRGLRRRLAAGRQA